jgi:hypothetical protein
MALPVGSQLYLLYDVPPPELYHERYVMASCKCGRGWHIILTPDHDLYAEQIGLENNDIQTFRLGVGDELPTGLNDANTYRIRRMPEEGMMRQLRRDAAHAAAALVVPPGAPAGALAPAAAPVGIAGAAPAQADGHEVWVRVESEGEKMRGEVVGFGGRRNLAG